MNSLLDVASNGYYLTVQSGSLLCFLNKCGQEKGMFTKHVVVNFSNKLIVLQCLKLCIITGNQCTAVCIHRSGKRQYNFNLQDHEGCGQKSVLNMLCGPLDGAIKTETTG